MACMGVVPAWLARGSPARTATAPCSMQLDVPSLEESGLLVVSEIASRRTIPTAFKAAITQVARKGFT